FESLDWNHGVFLGSTVASERTAAAEGSVGVVRRDPMAMLPFCGYNMGEYFKHWIAMKKRMTKTPLIFGVNWFRKGSDGKFMWPGFGDNARVLKWIVERVQGKGKATEMSHGFVPAYDDLDWTGLATMTRERFERELMRVDAAEWKAELSSHTDFFAKFGAHAPKEFEAIQKSLTAGVSSSTKASRPVTAMLI
ncbi:MAG: phosphoenolpyruvate carboxykinase (GTP), partial [Deltaproteobacteria bacterium]|nr:phosphoenolpyruvate carboxykinase (GTP) [Deltaproteobacteria bacterium]